LFFWENNHFHIWKKMIQMHIFISKFQVLHFCFSDYVWFQKFYRFTLTFVFFFHELKLILLSKKHLMFFFLVKPWPLQQPRETKLLISVCLLKGQKFSFWCKLSYELQFAGLGWDLTNFYSKGTRIVENASLCSGWNSKA
jgi:hypothetical protein